MATGTIKKPGVVYTQHTQTVTTSSSGSAALDNAPQGVAVAAYCSSNDVIVLPVYTTTGQPWVKVLNWDMTVYGNKTVTVVVIFAT